MLHAKPEHIAQHGSNICILPLLPGQRWRCSGLEKAAVTNQGDPCTRTGLNNSKRLCSAGKGAPRSPSTYRKETLWKSAWPQSGLMRHTTPTATALPGAHRRPQTPRKHPRAENSPTGPPARSQPPTGGHKSVPRLFITQGGADKEVFGWIYFFKFLLQVYLL